MKKALSVLSAMAVALSLFTAASLSVLAGTTGYNGMMITAGDYRCTVYEDGTAAIYDYSGTASELEIPSTIGGYKVTAIGGNAFYKNTRLTCVSIPDTVTDIGMGAFFGCSFLASVKIPDSVTRINSGAFGETEWYYQQPSGPVYAGKVIYDVKDLCPAEIEINEGTLGIAGHAFSGCDKLTSVIIPDSVTTIGQCAFQYCDHLTSVNIPDSVTDIGDHAFEVCTALSAVSIPESVTRIASGTFRRCSSLVDVKIPGSVTDIESYAFLWCDSLTAVTIPDSVTSLGKEAFSGCSSLTSVTIGNKVASIGAYAFGACSKLISVTIPKTVTEIKDRAFGYYYDEGYRKAEDFTIFGYNGSAAESYANDNGFTFVVIEDDPTEPQKIRYLGDVDGDGEVSIRDATFIQRKLSGLAVPFAFSEMIADADEDGTVTVVDATHIQRSLVGLKANPNIGKPVFSGFPLKENQ